MSLNPLRLLSPINRTRMRIEDAYERVCIRIELKLLAYLARQFTK